MLTARRLGLLWVLLAVAGCDDGADPSGEPTVPSDPCAGVDCGGHGSCVTAGGQASCECDAGYGAADGLECLPDCSGVDCSGHGTCLVENDEPRCACEPTYHAEGLDCVLDELPNLSCEQGWVTHHLADPISATSRALHTAAPLRLGTRTIDPFDDALCSRGGQVAGTLAFVRLEPEPRQRPTALLRSVGVERLEPVKQGFQLVWIPNGDALRAMCGLPQLTAAVEVCPADKIGSRLARRGAGQGVPVLVRRLAGAEREHLEASHARRLAGDPRVLRVSETSGLVPLTDVARQAVHTEQVQATDLTPQPPTYDGPVGRGIVLAVVDTGVDADHPDMHAFGPGGVDLGTRVVGDLATGDSHGTNVAGIAAGNGLASEGVSIEIQTGTPHLWRGHAPAIETIASVLMGFHPWTKAYVEHDAFVSNHSYTQSDGRYSTPIAQFDEVIRLGAQQDEILRPPRVAVFAAANSGLSAKSNSPLMGYYSILAPGKNPICVGGSHANDDTYAVGASAGPTLDGRIKPDIVAPGFKQYRPPDGVGVEIDEIRLRATATSGVPDRVWSFDAAGDLEGWVVGDALLDAQVAGGVLAATAVGATDGDAEALSYDVVANDGGPLAAADYDELQVTLRLDVAGTPGQYQWAFFWVVSWDYTGDDGFDGNLYPRYEPEWQDDQLHQHLASLTSSSQWTGQIRRLRVWPTPYDYRIIMPVIGGGYGRSTGTSLAAPIASGVVAMMMEQLQTDHGVDVALDPPLPSTFKALLVQTATDLVHEQPFLRDPANPDTGESVLYYPGPDFATGYGLLDAWRATSLVDAHGSAASKWVEQTIEHGEEHVYVVPVVDGLAAGALKATLAWDDAPGSTYLDDTEPTLVNDLDLVLVGPDGSAHSPWILEPLPIDEDIWDGVEPIAPADVVPAAQCVSNAYWTGPDSAACEDHRNNVEQVVVSEAGAGWYVLRVRGAQVPEGPQRYSLVVSQPCGG